MILILGLFGVAIVWVGWIASGMEVNMFFYRIMLSFLYLGLGFFFFGTGYPERRYSNYWIHIIAQGHVFWHIFVSLNGYTLYWTLFDALKHIEDVELNGLNEFATN